MYSIKNYKTKKALKEAVAKGDAGGIFQYGPFGGNEPKDGTVYLEGPHYPEAHRWYAEAEIKDGIIIKVK